MKPLVTVEMVRGGGSNHRHDVTGVSHGHLFCSCTCGLLFESKPTESPDAVAKFDAHVIEETVSAFNAALEPLLAEREAAILRQAADVVAFGNHLLPAEQIRKILALSPADALARHDAAVRLEEADRECWPDPPLNSRDWLDWAKHCRELGRMAADRTRELRDQLAALEGKP